MSGIMPLFTSAPRIKIRLSGQTIAYAIGFNINVSVDVQEVYALGHYGPISLEPTFQNAVTGTLQIVRLTSPAASSKIVASATAANTDQTAPFLGTGSPSALVTDSFGQGSFSATPAISKGDVQLSLGTLFAHLDPANVLASQSFDLEVYLRVHTDTSTSVVEGDVGDETLWLVVSDCRLTGRSANITLAQLINEPVNFQGLLVSPVSETGAVIDGFGLDAAITENGGKS